MTPHHPTLIVFSTQMTASGGIENHLVRLCEHLSAAGISLLFFCPDYRLGDGLDRRLRAACRGMVILSGNSGRLPACMRFGWLMVKTLTWPEKWRGVLYLNGQGGSPYWVAKILRRKVSKVVLHHHSAGDASDIVSWPESYHRLMERADSVIACSTTNAEAVFKNSDREVEVVYCYSESAGELQKRATGGSVNFGFFGRLIPEKGIDTILRLSKEPALSDIHWHLWGPCEGYSPKFTDGFPNLEYHGLFHDRAGLLDALSRLDAFTLFSTHNEGLPLTLLEAMGAGVPWLASDRGGIRDLVLDSTSTILLADGFGYPEALSATRRLADLIKSGCTDPRKLQRAYNDRFQSAKITRDWFRVFGFAP